MKCFCLFTDDVLNTRYECINKKCDRTTGLENIDWGSYAAENGNCIACKDSCSKNVSCESVECGESYCVWWKNGKCDEAHELTESSDILALTCLKHNKSMLIKITTKNSYVKTNIHD